MNVFKTDLNGVLNNKEFKELIKVMGCNVGMKFDLSKLQFNKIVIASDADIDGLNIRSLLCSFFFKIFPEIVEDGRLFIAEPPLYRVSDKKNPFVINKEDYIDRYITAAIKDYDIGLCSSDDSISNFNDFMDKKSLKQFLSDTSFYLDVINSNAFHYKVNEQLIEAIYNHLASRLSIIKSNGDEITDKELLSSIDYNLLMQSVNEIFKELFYSESENIIKGAIDGKYQSIEINERLVRRGREIVNLIHKYNLDKIILRSKKDKSILVLSPLEALKILKKYQPDIVHRFKGLGENDSEDIKTTVMDPNTRILIKCNIDNFENDMKLFSILRGSSVDDATARKKMVRDYQLNTSYRELMEQIDT